MDKAAHSSVTIHAVPLCPPHSWGAGSWAVLSVLPCLTHTVPSNRAICSTPRHPNPRPRPSLVGGELEALQALHRHARLPRIVVLHKGDAWAVGHHAHLRVGKGERGMIRVEWVWKEAQRRQACGVSTTQSTPVVDHYT